MKPVALILALLLTSAAFAADGSQDLKLWYAQPAQVEKDWKYPAKSDQQAKGWLEALPVGSGRLGAMVFGGVAEERIQFNEDTLWTGKPRDYVRAGAREHLPHVRELVFAGKQEEASNLFRKSMISDPVRQKAYQPF